MPSVNKQIQWLQSKQNILISELLEQSNNTDDPTFTEALTKIVELIEIGQQIQSVYAIHLMASLKQSENEIDDQLNEIAGYMESIILSKQREAENLRKVQ
jgi:UDP-N-acetylglucosamine 2-epimerase